MRKEYQSVGRIWDIIYPVGIYYITIVVVMFCAQLLLGTGVQHYMICKTIGSLAALWVVWTHYRQDLALEGKLGRRFRISRSVVKNILWILGITTCISIALNNIITMSPIMEWSKSYEDTASVFYGGSLWSLLLGSALVTPILEEMLHRGVVYGRLCKMTGKWSAILLSALVFAGLHFNLVQFTYAFLLGILFAFFMDQTDCLGGPVLAHVWANTIAILRTETGFLKETADQSIFAWCTSIGLLLIGCVGVLIYRNLSTGKEHA